MDGYFDYVVGRYRKGSKGEVFLAGFPLLMDAQKYAEYFSGDYLFNGGFMFIDSSEGVHILGKHDHSSAKSEWYAPDNIHQAIIFDSTQDENVDLSSYLPIDDYYRFTKGISLHEQRISLRKSLMEQELKTRSEKYSIHERLSQNKEIISQRTETSRDNQAEKENVQHNNETR